MTKTRRNLNPDLASPDWPFPAIREFLFELLAWYVLRFYRVQLIRADWTTGVF